MARDPGDLDAFKGHPILDRSGSRIGRLESLHNVPGTTRCRWGEVQLEGAAKTKFVPLTGLKAAGDKLRIEYDKSLVMDAPTLKSLGGTRYEDLRRHYWFGEGASHVPKPTGPPDDWP